MELVRIPGYGESANSYRDYGSYPMALLTIADNN